MNCGLVEQLGHQMSQDGEVATSGQPVDDPKGKQVEEGISMVC